ncbi:phage replication protein [Escherichia coli]|uniref:Phage replication protein n=1 Tax=Escherichia coli TaxID=562 RepID=A0A2X3LRC2_ECOLX|nr:phage replication protein [Escherichia coli]
MLENEDGFTIDLETVYYAGVSNPVHRKAEMMATMKGLELLAEARGDRAVFLTVTWPVKIPRNNGERSSEPQMERGHHARLQRLPG